ncbi:hypothetical protein FKO01_51805 [Mesorhizobium sp. B2-3-3]|nr:hypothetical protein FJ958_19805 [Mesorhizobium sp. B2-3-5]TPM98735.1 hypothetical protein FKO01_51805 [Mesorhizobium sp. B2-3-3]
MNSIFGRNERMSVRRPSMVFASAVLAAAVLAGVAVPASAQALNPAANGNALIQQNDLQILQNRVQREQFQQQQQQYRAQDRVIVQQPPPVVPKVGPTCQTQIIGNTAVSTCR